jgi:hypothetical protein
MTQIYYMEEHPFDVQLRLWNTELREASGHGDRQKDQTYSAKLNPTTTLSYDHNRCVR